MLASFFYVMWDEPGNRGDIALPRPEGFVAVAIKAGALGQVACFRGVPVGFLDHRGIGVLVAVADELDQDKGGDESKNEYLMRLISEIFIFPPRHWI